MLAQSNGRDSTGGGSSPTPQTTEPAQSAQNTLATNEATKDPRSDRKARDSRIGDAPVKGIESVVTGAEDVLRVMLFDIVHDVKDRQLRAYYRNEKLPTVDLIGVLRHSTKEDCLDLIQQFLTKTANSPEWLDPVKRRLPFLLHAAEPDSRASMIKGLLALKKTTEQQELIVGILSASKTLEDLKVVIDLVGKSKLVATKNTDIQDLVAKAYVTLEIRNIEIPDRIPWQGSKRTQSKSLDDGFSALEGALNLCTTICKSYPELSKTETVQRAIENATSAISEMHDDLKHSASLGEKRSLYHRLALEIGIEFHYGISISTQQQKRHNTDGSTTHTHACRWTENNLRELRLGLDAFPGDMIVINPVGREIRRMPQPKDKAGNELDSTLAEWDPTNLRIAVYDNAAVRFNPRRDQPEERLRSIIAHELWHGILQGNRTKVLNSWYDTATGALTLESANPEWDFDLFCAKAGWKVVLDKHQLLETEIPEGERGVRFLESGQEVRLGRPVKFKGAPVIFNYFGGELYVHDALATFPARTYSESSPYEHFCEAGASYLLNPEVLIQYSIKDFEFFEKRLRVYDDPNSPILKAYRAKVDQDLIEKRLAKP